MRVPGTAPSPPLLAGRAYGRSVFRITRVIRLVAVATGLLLSNYPVGGQVSTRPPASAASGYGEEGRYDCSVGRRIDVEKHDREALEDGLRGAFELLERCAACRGFFGNNDPVGTLKVLRDAGRIVVTDEYPTVIPPRGASRLREIVIEKFEHIEKGLSKDLKRLSKRLRQLKQREPRKAMIYAATVDFIRKPEGRFVKPCIYLNRARYLGSTPKDAGDRSHLRRQRGLALLHELAHIVNVIPRDGTDELVVWRSMQNQLCIVRNCFSPPCAAKSVACVHEPEPRPDPRRRGAGARAAPASPGQRRQP